MSNLADNSDDLCASAMDWDDFQRRAKGLVPKQYLKPEKLWIGVLRHDKSPESSLTESDFIWNKGNQVSSTGASQQ